MKMALKVPLYLMLPATGWGPWILLFATSKGMLTKHAKVPAVKPIKTFLANSAVGSWKKDKIIIIRGKILKYGFFNIFNSLEQPDHTFKKITMSNWLKLTQIVEFLVHTYQFNHYDISYEENFQVLRIISSVSIISSVLKIFWMTLL